MITPRPFISAESVTEGAEAVVYSNVSVVNVSFEELLLPEDIAPAALQSYHVDFWLAQVNNGGCAQFFENGGRDERVIQHVTDGLTAMGADRFLDVWERSLAVMRDLGPDLQPDNVFGSGALQEAMSPLDDEFYRLAAEGELTELNAAWLLSLPDLDRVPRAIIEQHLADIVARVPNLAERQAEAAAWREAHMPEYERNIRALCSAQGIELHSVNAGDPTFVFGGAATLAWFYSSSDGLQAMVIDGSDAVAVDGESHKELARVPAWLPAS